MEQALNHINIALWIIVIFSCMVTVAFVVTLYFVVKLIKQVMDVLSEVKTQTQIIAEKIDPFINTATDTLREIKSASAKINILSKKFLDGVSNVGNFINYFTLFKGFAPGNNKFGFLSGLMSGFNIFNAIKKSKKNK